ncbi:hypothetical protein NXC12_PE00134 (plasmid) [Rhizobium etli]|uniref:Uncharacterized protein n=1 Tax=Rhizobium etli TaxID=29449 RepID=A0AAN1ENM5_RHIET|nr:hypothetical protein NXC12_PE00134 [Rhizobium etli]
MGALSGLTFADFETPGLLVGALFVGIIIGMAVEQLLTATMWRGVASTKIIVKLGRLTG